MTAIYYPDRCAVSSNGQWLVEARSPDNGTITDQAGNAATNARFGFKYKQHQQDFRYRLLRVSNPARLTAVPPAGDVVWERWQFPDEDSPGEIVVADDGWCIIRTRGFMPDVIAISPDGKDRIRVAIVRDDDSGYRDLKRPREGKASVWSAKHLGWTSAGDDWAGDAWPYFFRSGGKSYFAWRTSWGDRLVLDLEHGCVIEHAASLRSDLMQAEAKSVATFLAEMDTQVQAWKQWWTELTSDDRDVSTPAHEDLFRRLCAAFCVAMEHKLSSCLPSLRRWETVEAPSRLSKSEAFTSRVWLETECLRPVLHHTLKMLGEEPQGFAAYHFLKTREDRMPMREHPFRHSGVIPDISADMAPQDVLLLLGAPAHVRREWRSIAPGFDGRTEQWEYDVLDGQRWSTYRIEWAQYQGKTVLVGQQRIEPYWLTGDGRLKELVRR